MRNKDLIKNMSLSPSCKGRSRFCPRRSSVMKPSRNGSFKTKNTLTKPLSRFAERKTSGKKSFDRNTTERNTTEKTIEKASDKIITKPKKKRQQRPRYTTKNKILINSEQESQLIQKLEKSWKDQENKIKMITEETKSAYQESETSVPWLNISLLQNENFLNPQPLFEVPRRKSIVHTRRHSKNKEFKFTKGKVNRRQSVLSVIKKGNLLAPSDKSFQEADEIQVPRSFKNLQSLKWNELLIAPVKKVYKVPENLVNPPRCAKDHLSFTNNKNKLVLKNKKEKLKELKKLPVRGRRNAKSTFSVQDHVNRSVRIYENPILKSQNRDRDESKNLRGQNNRENNGNHRGNKHISHYSSVQYSADSHYKKDFQMIRMLSKSSIVKYSKKYLQRHDRLRESELDLTSGEQDLRKPSSRNFQSSFIRSISKNRNRNFLTNRVSHLGLSNNSNDLSEFLRSGCNSSFRPARIYLNNQ
ncbi:unnamed protein product [Moneuplotes crassus]|uniref:Uncharacterized protein n=1 Tax=Euplotes crassus TaxID=5936 RepID=A0AAD1Y749_EUPCR|nr:unnamed protein product [Moneuplotes crassus]